MPPMTSSSSPSSRTAGPLVRPVIAMLLAAAAGLLMVGSFAPFEVGWLAPVSVAVLLVALFGTRPRRAFGLGCLAGIVFFALLMPWLRVVGDDAWLLLSGFCALWFGLAGIGMSLVMRLPGWPWWVAGVWVLQEALRGRVPLGGFPWGRLAYGQPDTTLGRLAWLVGQPGVSFAIVLLGACLVAAMLALKARTWPKAAAWAALAVVIVAGSAAVRPSAEGDLVGGSSSAVIAAIQGGTPQTGLGAMDVRRAVLDNHVAQTVALAGDVEANRAPRPTFVVWPENSSDIDPFVDPAAARAISEAARAIDAPILVGAVVNVPGNPQGVWNLGVVWDPLRGPGQRYVKTHPVPFGEYIPFRGILATLIGRFDRIPRDFVPGSTPGNLDIGGVAVGNVICFEVAYDDVIDPVIANGARVITVQTNNATYQGTAQPAQQFQIERMRAIQTQRSVVVAATSGISAIIAPDGSVRSVLDEGAVGAIEESVALRGSDSPSTWLGPSLEWLGVLIGLGPVAWLSVAGLRSTRKQVGSRAGRRVGT